MNKTVNVLHVVDPSGAETTRLWKDELLAVIDRFHARGWSPATSSNYSFRNSDGNTITISRSGVDKSAFALADFMVVDDNGLPLREYRHLKPSDETLIHTTLYKRPSIQAVLHTHTVANTTISLRYQSEHTIKLKGFELLKGFHGVVTHDAEITIPIIDNSQDIKNLSRTIADLPGDVPGFLLSGHGLYAWGRTIAEAKRHVETFEFLFECVNTMDMIKR